MLLGLVEHAAKRLRAEHARVVRLGWQIGEEPTGNNMLAFLEDMARPGAGDTRGDETILLAEDDEDLAKVEAGPVREAY